MIPPSTFASDRLAPADTPLGDLGRRYFLENWQQARDGLLSRTDRVRVVPGPGPGPTWFRFEMDVPFKRKERDGPVELAPGPVRGAIFYRPDLMALRRDEPAIAVFVDRGQQLFHPNVSRDHGFLCVGDVPPGPFPLEFLIEFLYGVLTYQIREPGDPVDLEAARYFALDPEAMAGLETVRPLY